MKKPKNRGVAIQPSQSDFVGKIFKSLLIIALIGSAHNIASIRPRGRVDEPGNQTSKKFKRKRSKRSPIAVRAELGQVKSISHRIRRAIKLKVHKRDARPVAVSRRNVKLLRTTLTLPDRSGSWVHANLTLAGNGQLSKSTARIRALAELVRLRLCDGS